MQTEYVAAGAFLGEKHEPTDYATPIDNNDCRLAKLCFQMANTD